MTADSNKHTTMVQLIEKADHLSADVLASRFFVIHNALRGGQHDVTELTAGKQVASPHLDLVHLDIEARRDATALVEATNEVDHDLAGAVIVDHGDVTNVAYSLATHRTTYPSSACTGGTSGAPSSRGAQAPDACHASPHS